MTLDLQFSNAGTDPAADDINGIIHSEKEGLGEGEEIILKENFGGMPMDPDGNMSSHGSIDQTAVRVEAAVPKRTSTSARRRSSRR